MTLREFTGIIETMIPLELAEGWDNTGLQAGSPSVKIRKIHLAVDCCEATINEALALKADLLLTHHPVIFKPVRRVTDEDPEGKVLIQAVSSGLSLYAAHTNMDVMYHDTLGKLFELKGIRPISVRGRYGLGCYGRLDKPVSFGALIRMVKTRLGVRNPRSIGDVDRMIRTVAFCGGAGREFIDASLVRRKIDALVTADIGHHDGLKAVSLGLALVDAGHYHTEKIMLERLENGLRRRLKGRLKISVSRIDTTPYNEERINDR